MDLTDNYYELKKQYCVIARARIPDAAQFEAQRIIGGLANQLGPHITSSNILYDAPNFIIHVDTVYSQRNILSMKTFQTAGFNLDVLPWSQEHEKTQLPWMPAQAQPQWKIEIDPLMIAPRAFSDAVLTGPHDGNHNCALGIGAPCHPPTVDLSYLIIADTKDHYYNKHALFCTSKAKAAEITAVTGLYTTEIISNVSSLSQNLQMLQSTGLHHVRDTLRAVLPGLQRISDSTSTHSSMVFRDMSSISEGPDSILNFDYYQRPELLTAVTIPEDYVDYLRVIHAQATRKAYGLESFFTTAETTEGKYEAFRTMGLMTHKYIGQSLHSPAAVESTAIYHSIKAITNWMGYNIIDMNYPFLAKLMAALQGLDGQMVLLQSIAYNSSEHSNGLYVYLDELQAHCSTMQDLITETHCITEAMQRFTATVQRYYHTIIGLSNGFFVAKVNLRNLTTEQTISFLSKTNVLVITACAG